EGEILPRLVDDVIAPPTGHRRRDAESVFAGAQRAVEGNLQRMTRPRRESGLAQGLRFGTWQGEVDFDTLQRRRGLVAQRRPHRRSLVEAKESGLCGLRFQPHRSEFEYALAETDLIDPTGKPVVVRAE